MKRGLIASLAVLALGLGSSTQVAAASQIIVTPTKTQGWTTADTRPGGTVTFVADRTAPGHPHRGALQLTTDSTTAAKAQYLHSANTPLADVTQASYHTKQVSGPAVADAAYQLVTCLTGAGAGACNPSLPPPPLTTPPSSFTTLVFEPYLNGLIIPGAWQYWDVAATGRFWSTRTVGCENGVVVGGPGGVAFYTLAELKTLCPNALVFQFGVNLGSFNPNDVVRTDLFSINGTVYNFEPARGHGNDNGDDGIDNDNDEVGRGSDSEE